MEIERIKQNNINLKLLEIMKTKIFFSALIFIGMIICLKGLSVGIDRIPLSNLQWGLEKVYIWFLVILSSAVFSIIPFTPIILKKIFGRSWEI